MADTTEQRAEQLFGVVNDTARTVSTRFVTFLTVGVYIAVTIASTTDEMLVKGSLVTLPLLNTNIPISGWFGFYAIAPWLIVALHLDLLLQLSTLASKLSRYNKRVEVLTDEQRDRFRERMPTFTFLQFLEPEQDSRFVRSLSAFTICGSMIVFPLLLLCWTQTRLLTVHDLLVTTSHRLAVLADVVLVLTFLWPPLTTRDAYTRSTNGARTLGWLMSLRTLAVVICVAVVAFSLVAGIPGEQREGRWFEMRNLDLRQRVLTVPPLSPDAVNLLSDGDAKEREDQLRKVSRLDSLQGRDLRYAKFPLAVLPRFDLRSQRVRKGDLEETVETRLQGADFAWAQMQEVLLDDANLEGANLYGTRLQGASMSRAKMEGANLVDAQLQDAKLGWARLDKSVLRGASLQGADLSNASVQESVLVGAHLEGALLRSTQLQRSDLSEADLQGADLSGAQLEWANLHNANLKGALLDGAVVGGANLDGANLELTVLDPAVPKCPDPKNCVDPRYPGGRSGVLATFLADLACADPYTMRGLSAQALFVDHADRKNLANVLITKPTAGSKCRGLEFLPEGTREALERKAATPPRKP